MIQFFNTITAILLDPLFGAAYAAFSLLLSFPGVTFSRLIDGLIGLFL